jgi:hypothetical protein
MNRGHRRGYVVVATATVVGGLIFSYRVRPLVGITFGSIAVVLAVLAHLGVLAVVYASIVALRRRSHQDRRT